MSGEVKDTWLIAGQYSALDFVGQPAVVAIPFSHVLCLARHFSDEFAIVSDFDLAEAFAVALDQISELH